VLTIWGKGVLFLFLGFFIFATHGFNLFVAIFFWAVFVAYVILFFFADGSSVPLIQKNSPPNFEVSEADYYSQSDGRRATDVAMAPAANEPGETERRYTEGE
jgi:hypothetical protein